MRSKTRANLLLAVAVSLATLLAPAAWLPSAHAQEQDSTGIASMWVAALDAHDVEGALSLLDQDAFLTMESADGNTLVVYEGTANIRTLLQDMAARGTRVQLVGTPQVINGTLAWGESRSTQAERDLGVAPTSYIANALIQNGKIRSLIYSPNQGSAGGTGAVGIGMPRTGATVLPPMITALLLLGLLSVALGLGLVRKESKAQRMTTK